jgi:hypothetical protein
MYFSKAARPASHLFTGYRVGSFRGSKATEVKRLTDHSSPSGTKVKIEWSYPSTLTSWRGEGQFHLYQSVSNTITSLKIRRFEHFDPWRRLRGFETSGSDYPLKQRHVPEERNSRLHRCENRKIRIDQGCTNPGHRVALATKFVCGKA